MIIKFNSKDIADIETLKKVINSNPKDFEIEIVNNDNEWLQLSCENSVISAARKINQKITYYESIKKNKLYDLIYLYYTNSSEFIIEKEYLSIRKNKKSSMESLKNIFLAFLISLFLMIIQSIFIVMNSTKYGSLTDKIFGYYFDNSITPYQKSLPVCVIVFFILCIIYSIKVLKEKKSNMKKRKRNSKDSCEEKNKEFGPINITHDKLGGLTGYSYNGDDIKQLQTELKILNKLLQDE